MLVYLCIFVSGLHGHSSSIVSSTEKRETKGEGMLALTLMAHTEVLLSIQAEAHQGGKLVRLVTEMGDRHEISHNTKRFPKFGSCFM